jgi:hypothetical protein
MERNYSVPESAAPKPTTPQKTISKINVLEYDEAHLKIKGRVGF